MGVQAFKRGTNNLYRFLRGLSIEILYPISMPPFLPTILPGSKSISRILQRKGALPLVGQQHSLVYYMEV